VRDFIYTIPEKVFIDVSKAKIAYESSGHVVSDHFADVGKMIQMPKGAQKTIDDIMLTRYACYLVDSLALNKHGKNE
jgi:DNA-directed RNA polymerase subunit N (RpoN/RPB10)